MTMQCAFFPRMTALAVQGAPGADNDMCNTIHKVNLELDSLCHLMNIINVNACTEHPRMPDFTMALDGRTLVFGGTGPESHYEEIEMYAPQDLGIGNAFVYTNGEFKTITQAIVDGDFWTSNRTLAHTVRRRCVNCNGSHRTRQ